MKKYFEIDQNNSIFEFLEKNYQQEMHANTPVKIAQFVNILTAILAASGQTNMDKITYEKYFVFAIIWGLGGLFDM